MDADQIELLHSVEELSDSSGSIVTSVTDPADIEEDFSNHHLPLAGQPPASQLLDAWCEAIRTKPNWPLKVLDEERDLLSKWFEEAKLEERGTPRDSFERAAKELKAEAKRIQTLDNWTFLSSGHHAEDAEAPLFDLLDSVTKALADVPSALKTPVLRDNVGVRTADGIVPKDVHSLLVSELDKLIAQSRVQDYHPGSDGKVLDILHPSMYPYVAGETQLVSGSGPEGGSFDTTTELQLFSEYGEVPDPVPHSSLFAWIPSVFKISDDGQAKIQGYINNLGPRSHHPGLYAAIESIFTLALPLIQESFNAPFERVLTESYQRWMERHAFREDDREGRGMRPDEWFAFVDEQKRKADKGGYKRKLDENQPEWNGMRGRTDLKGKEVKVIVKVAEYHLKPGQTYEGSWHIEGAPHEMIGSSLIYYYETSPEIKDKGLSLRRVRLEGDKPDDAEEHGGNDYEVSYEDEEGEWLDADDWEGERALTGTDVPSDWGSDFSPYNYDGSLPLGTVRTTGGVDASETGKMVCFPNWVQHRVTGLENTAQVEKGVEGQIAKRKILCFFVVREDRDTNDSDKLTLPGLTYTGLSSIPPVITTLQVPPQQHHLLYPQVAFWLTRACASLTGTSLPVELGQKIFSMSGSGFSREDAERYRREVMADRGVLVKKGDEAWSAEFGLCEH